MLVAAVVDESLFQFSCASFLRGSESACLCYSKKGGQGILATYQHSFVSLAHFTSPHYIYSKQWRLHRYFRHPVCRFGAHARCVNYPPSFLKPPTGQLYAFPTKLISAVFGYPLCSVYRNTLLNVRTYLQIETATQTRDAGTDPSSTNASARV